MNKTAKHVLIGFFIAGLIQWISYPFFIGLVLGILSTIVIIYVLTIKFVQTHHGNEITVSFVTDQIDQALNPVKKKKEHYVNRFTNYFQCLPENEKDSKPKTQNLDLTVNKLGRKKFQKFLDSYSQFIEEIKDAEQSLAESLSELENRGKITSEAEYTVIHKYSDLSVEIIQELSGIQVKVGYQLLLPQWRDFRKILKQFGICHQEQSKMIQANIAEQIQPIKKEYQKEIEEFRKNRKKLKQINVECYQHFQKIQTEYNQIDKERLNQQQIYENMLKKKEDPTLIIKQEMKLKIQMSNLDNIRTKMNDAKERIKDVQNNLTQFNLKLSVFINKYEEQRLVYLKQCFQTSLVGFEDMAHKIQSQISNLIVILDEESSQIYPVKLGGQVLSPQNTFVQMIQNGTIEELHLNEQMKECIRSTEFTLQQWNALQKYNEEVETFFKELVTIFQQQTAQLDKDFSGVKKILDLEKSRKAESLIVIISCHIKACIIMKELDRQLSDGLEKRRQEIGKHRLDMQVGIQVVQCAQRDLSKLEQLFQDERMIEKYQEESNLSKSKKVAQHFMSEMKSSFKNVQSFGKLVSNVGQSMHKVQKMSTYSEDDRIMEQQRINDEQKNLISLLGFTLKNLEELINKQYKAIGKLKKSFVEDLGRYSNALNTHIGLIIDEMTRSISIIQSRQEEEIIKEAEVEIEETQAAQIKESIEDVDIHTTPQIIQKLLKVYFNEWKQNEYFLTKIKKLLHKALNKKRVSALSEIQISQLDIIGDPPLIQNVYPQRQDMEEFLYDFDLSFRGKVQFTITTSLTINWPKQNSQNEQGYTIPVEVKVAISTFTSRIRLCFVPRSMGKSWISMIGTPVLNLDLEPRVLQKYNIANIPSVGSILKEFLIHKVKLMTFPNKLTIPIPLSKKSSK